MNTSGQARSSVGFFLTLEFGLLVTSAYQNHSVFEHLLARLDNIFFYNTYASTVHYPNKRIYLLTIFDRTCDVDCDGI